MAKTAVQPNCMIEICQAQKTVLTWRIHSTVCAAGANASLSPMKKARWENRKSLTLCWSSDKDACLVSKWLF